ncbi:MAG: caspase family protein [Candidatus Tectomicrobia bacterium]|nr:caspase family protein [Candidatus Tectomicrobia bacterium]
MQSVRLRSLVLVVLATMAWVSSSPAADRALLVGVGDYAQVSDLPGIDLDVAMMQEAAERLGFREIRTLLDQEATYDRFKALFERWLINGTRSGDRVLLYFSGHGGCVADQDGDEADGKDEVLILHDTRLRGGRMENALRDDEFNALLQRLSGRYVLVLIDACHSGTSHRGFNLHGNRSLGAKAIRVSEERWETFTKTDTELLNCLQRQAGRREKTFEIADTDQREGERQNIAFLAAAEDHELALATGKGSLFTLGLRKAIDDATSEQESLNLRRLRERVANFIQDSIDSGDVRGTVHHPQLGGATDFPLRMTTPRDGGGPIWRQLVELAGRNDLARLPIEASRRRFRVGDELILSIDIPHAGYLNVVNVGSHDNATVLFPNKHHRDNYIQEGRLRIPTPEMRFRIQAAEPTGPSLNVAFLTERRIDLYEEGVGGRDKDGHYEALLNALSAKATKSIRSAVVVPTSGYRAAGGKVIVEVGH